ncbi:hypothetical protein NPX13_g6827 [Xylaria arbuscula]|uniref:Uncharacterized protein n=1 Tax=Xylaria arbuscula TaxID=114810 RepID=A0A9W8NBM1_9PEZI|nr:hypothetical protein NPX13_g6827 [Xylaria arbuscula]
MADPKPQRQKWLASEVAAFSDTELDNFIEESRLQCGIAMVEVEDPENLPESFIQRLRDRAQGSPSGIARPRAIDLDQVNAKLLDYADYCSGSSSPSPRPPAPIQCDEESTKSPTPPEVHATIYYNKLVLDGGRPLYPIQLMDVISKNPQDYRDLLQPWQEHPNVDIPSWDVFWDQWASWRGFRHWQVQNRTVSHHSDLDVTTILGTFVTKFRHGSMSYEAGLEELFAHYNVTHPYRIHQDPETQDKMTTWLEYVACAYSCHHMLELRVEREKPAYDTAWQFLLEKGVVKASDTRKSAFNREAISQHQRYMDQAWAAVESAKAALLSAQQNEATNREGSCIAQSELDAAQEALAALYMRERYVGGFFTDSRAFFNAETSLECSSNQLRWILEQIPLIELEMKESHGVTTSLNIPRGVKRRDEDSGAGMVNEKNIKRQRNSNNQSCASPDHASALSLSERVAESPLSRHMHHASSIGEPRSDRRAEGFRGGNGDKPVKCKSSNVRERRSACQRETSLSKEARSLDQQWQQAEHGSSQITVGITALRRSARISQRKIEGKPRQREGTTGLRRSARIKALQELSRETT